MKRNKTKLISKQWLLLSLLFIPHCLHAQSVDSQSYKKDTLYYYAGLGIGFGGGKININQTPPVGSYILNYVAVEVGVLRNHNILEAGTSAYLVLLSNPGIHTNIYDLLVGRQFVTGKTSSVNILVGAAYMKFFYWGNTVGYYPNDYTPTNLENTVGLPVELKFSEPKLNKYLGGDAVFKIIINNKALVYNFSGFITFGKLRSKIKGDKDPDFD